MIWGVGGVLRVVVVMGIVLVLRFALLCARLCPFVCSYEPFCVRC